MGVDFTKKIHAKTVDGVDVILPPATKVPDQVIMTHTEDGERVFIAPDSQLFHEDDITVTCDGNGCGSETCIIQWKQDQRSDNNEVPAAASSIVMIELFTGEKKAFGTPKCAAKYLSSLEAPKKVKKSAKVVQFPEIK